MNRQDSMLEAFRDATSRAEGSAAGPFADSAKPAPSSSGGSGDARRWMVALAALGLVFVLGVWVGRATGGAVEAAGPEVGATLRHERDDLAAALQPNARQPEHTSPVARGEVDTPVAPLYDRKNKYTVVAISVTRANEDLAWSNHDHLRANGLPAFPPFPVPNGMLVVVVGAAPKESNLKEVRSRLQRLPGPDGRGRPYEGAYFSPINSLLDRGER